MLLSRTMGLIMVPSLRRAGFRGQIKLTGYENGDLNLTELLWTFQVGLKGESLKLYATAEGENTKCTELPPDAVATRFSWYKTCFDAPGGLDPVALDLSSMGKGQVWVYGHHLGLGRYWTLTAPKDGCQTCDYRGSYNSDKCWKANCTFRRKFLIWLLRHNRVMTNAELYRRHIITTPKCEFCGNIEESSLHALRDCPWARRIWKLVATKHLHRFFSLGVRDWVDWKLNSPMNRYVWCDKWDTSFIETVNWLWQVRNGALHEEDIVAPIPDINTLRQRIIESNRTSVANLDVTKDVLMIGWSKPRADFIKINVDGAVSSDRETNEGPAATGGVMRNKSGAWVAGFQGRVGIRDPLAVELEAIRQGLDIAWEMDMKKVIVETDCLEALKYIDEANIEHKDISCIRAIRDMLKRKRVVFIHHVYREANIVADTLAKKDLGMDWVKLPVPCDDIQDALFQDLSGSRRPRTISLGPDMSN